MAQKKSTTVSGLTALSIGSLGATRTTRLRSTEERRALALGIINPAELSLSHRKDIRVALYLRVSTSRSVESNLSIPEQERQLRLCCEQMGWKVVAVYTEEAKSAKTTNRPQFRRMVEDAQALDRPFSKILIWTTSRFARSASDYAVVEKLLQIGRAHV